MSNEGKMEIVGRLLELSKLDTVFRDLYLDRSRYFLEKDLPVDEYRSLVLEQKSLVHLPERIRRAMEQGDWGAVRELSGRFNILRRLLDRKHPLMEMGQSVYSSNLPLIDPFSPGLQALAGVQTTSLPILRDKSIQLTMRLIEDDPPWAPFYSRRQAAFRDLDLSSEKTDTSSPIRESRVEEEALGALKEGRFEQLERIAETLLKKETAPSKGGGEMAVGSVAGNHARDLFYTFPETTLTAAKRLGLFPARVESRRKNLAVFCRYAWHPPLFGQEETPEDALRLENIDLPPGTPEALKGRIQLLMLHPFINSGGGRFIPTLVAEDLLVETFPDPDGEGDGPPSALVEALGLRGRRGLTRIEIEQALLEKGGKIMKDELGLDPWDFRLLCIPPDIHLRLGGTFGWGEKPHWTHMDGYMVMHDRRLRSLAGGDVRFGGIYDLVGLGVNYASEGVIARFAVVQRERMKAW